MPPLSNMPAADGVAAQHHQQMQLPVNRVISLTVIFTVALAAFTAGTWSSSQRCKFCRRTTIKQQVANPSAPNQSLSLEAAAYREGDEGATPSLHGRDPALGVVQLREAASASHRPPAAVKGAVAVSDNENEIPEPTHFLPAFPENRGAASGESGAGVQTLQDEVAFLRRKVSALRQAYGTTHCKVHGIGPTGGFCVTNATAALGKVSGTLCDVSMCDALGKVVAGQRVADLGAGRGQYGKCLQPAVKQYTPYDGGEGVEGVTGGFVHFLDLSEPTWLGVTFDWVVSLEVGEHIPAKHQDTFISNVLRHADRGVVLSWAVPGQGGHHHVNERPNDYIAGRVKVLGRGRFVLNSTATAALRSAATFRWFKNTIMVFDRVGSED